MHTAWFKNTNKQSGLFLRLRCHNYTVTYLRHAPSTAFFSKTQTADADEGTSAAMPSQAFPKEADTKAQSHFQVFPQSFSGEHLTPQGTVIVTEISLCEMGAPLQDP